MTDIYNTRREERACKRCGFVRVVKVRDNRQYVETGQRDSHGMPVLTGEFKVVGESYEPHCRACKLEIQVAIYERNIRKLREQIKNERQRQLRADEKKKRART